MMSSILRIAAAGLLATSTLLGAVARGQARPIVPAERNFVPSTGQVDACSDSSVLDAIEERFQIRESHYWSSGLELLNFSRIRQIGYRTDGLDLVPRRYCEARAAFNDDKYRTVVYTIGEGLGFAGYGFGVEWCVQGLDRNYAFGPSCEAIKP